MNHKPSTFASHRSLSYIVIFLAFCVASFSQDNSYYTAIQRGSSAPAQPAEFKKLEQNALKDYSRPESYEALARAFGNTTEKVWAVIYGEVYCNLSSDSERAAEIGSLVFHWYDESLSKAGNNLSADLTENAQGIPNVVPFESQFEQSFLMGAITLGNDFPPLSIRKLTAIRRNQLSLWSQRKLPNTEILRRQQAILEVGHFDAYNYWLFKAARPQEFNEWLAGHQTEFQAWLDWQRENRFDIRVPDFQRLYMVRRLNSR